MSWSSGEESWSLGSVLEFSSVLRWVTGDGDDLDDDGDILGNKLWPGEKSEDDLSLLREDGGWNAEDDVKDFSSGVSPVMENIGLVITVIKMMKFNL